MSQKVSSLPYRTLCAEFYHLDKPTAPQDAISYYLKQLDGIHGPILEPMCGTGNFLLPITQAGYQITGFDNSKSMLDICHDKCRKQGLSCNLFESDFQKFNAENSFDLIIIPNGSFCLLTTEEEIQLALSKLYGWLHSDGKFILEIETLHAKSSAQEVWKARSIKKNDGSIIVLNYTAQFNQDIGIETVLCRYEHWKNNQILRTEVEEFNVKLYDPELFQKILEKHGFEVTRSLQPYNQNVHKESPIVLYECAKREYL